MLVAVQEDRLVARHEDAPDQPFDAIQLAIAAEHASTPQSSAAISSRLELLLVGGDAATGGSFLLATPGTSLSATRRPRPLETLRDEDTALVVWRDDGVTYYECSVSWKPLRDALRPSEGRAFCFSLLVHDPDGTGLRQWGSAAGMWPWERTPFAWSDWPGAAWEDQPPFDSKTPWGLCSSKY
jgi:hypothetical protein